MSGGAFENEYALVGHIYICMCCVYLKDSLECCVIYTLN